MKTDERVPSASEALWQRLNAEMAARKISQRALGRSAGVPASTLTRLKQGKTVTLTTANRLFAWLAYPRKAQCNHDWRLGYAVAGVMELYYCTHCLERRRLEAAV